MPLRCFLWVLIFFINVEFELKVSLSHVVNHYTLMQVPPLNASQSNLTWTIFLNSWLDTTLKKDSKEKWKPRISYSFVSWIGCFHKRFLTFTAAFPSNTHPITSTLPIRLPVFPIWLPVLCPSDYQYFPIQLPVLVEVARKPVQKKYWLGWEVLAWMGSTGLDVQLNTLPELLRFPVKTWQKKTTIKINSSSFNYFYPIHFRV